VLCFCKYTQYFFLRKFFVRGNLFWFLDFYNYICNNKQNREGYDTYWNDLVDLASDTIYEYGEVV